MPKFSEINERQKPINLKSTENPEQDKPLPPPHTRRHIIVKPLEKNKEKIFKATRGGKNYYIENNKEKNDRDFLSETV